MGTVRDLIGPTGAVVGHLDYDTFGAILAATGAVDRFAFQGREWEAAAGLYQFRARFYDPVLRQFTSEDPLGFAAGDANLKRFVFNNPQLFTDPSGMEVGEYALLAYNGAKQGAKVGAILGGICGFLDGLFAPAQNDAERWRNAALGGIKGAVAGAVFGAALGAVGGLFPILNIPMFGAGLAAGISWIAQPGTTAQKIVRVGCTIAAVVQGAPGLRRGAGDFKAWWKGPPKPPPPGKTPWRPGFRGPRPPRPDRPPPAEPRAPEPRAPRPPDPPPDPPRPAPPRVRDPNVRRTDRGFGIPMRTPATRPPDPTPPAPTPTPAPTPPRPAPPPAPRPEPAPPAGQQGQGQNPPQPPLRGVTGHTDRGRALEHMEGLLFPPGAPRPPRGELPPPVPTPPAPTPPAPTPPAPAPRPPAPAKPPPEQPPTPKFLPGDWWERAWRAAMGG
jgi:RHS repeat-associated protein